jgi:hypothetical protein
MNRALFIWFILSFSRLLHAQEFPRSMHPFKFKGRQLVVGNAVGKLEKEYRLLEDGGVYRRMSTDTIFEKIGDQSSKNIATAFKSLEDVKFKAMNFNNPGRTYKFVKYQKGKEQHAVIWGNPKQPAPEAIQRVYEAFMGMIPANMRL